MKRLLILMLTLLLVFAGCTQGPSPESTPAATQSTTAAPTETVPAAPSLYVPESALEQATGGLVKTYAPREGYLINIGLMGDDPVLFVGLDSGDTRVIRIRGTTGAVLAQRELEGIVDTWTGVTLGEDRMICHDLRDNTLRFYDGMFRPLHTLQIPHTVTGQVFIDPEQTEAYYTTYRELRALDLNTGISRLVLLLEDTELFLNQLLFDGTVVSCYVSGESDGYEGFFSTRDGTRIGWDDGLMNIASAGDRYLLTRLDGSVQELLVGRFGEPSRSFTSSENGFGVSLMSLSGNLLEQAVGELGLEMSLYEPVQGNRLARVALEGVQWASDPLEDSQGRAWFITTDPATGTDALCCWETAGGEGSDTLLRVGTRYTAENVDLEGLAACEEWARDLEDRFGVEILFYTDMVNPTEYAFTQEYQVSAISKALEALETELGKYPQGFFRKGAGVTENGRFVFNLVRSITGTAYNTVSDANGLQYWIDGNAYIALLAQDQIEMAIHHELCHALENYIRANSIHFDFWEDNNPEGFAYDLSYTEYPNHPYDHPWLQGPEKAFIDGYSMTYPVEDRARMLEYAMTPNHEDAFASETMQRKLKQLCLGLRDAFGWKKHTETFAWEQYLEESLAYQG